jgi:hypothetical protein
MTRLARAKQLFDKRVVAPLLNPLFVETNADYRNTVFLAGTERSGTTWISEIINYRREYRYIFEPFWPLKVDLWSELGSHQYLRPDDHNPSILAATETILSGRIRNEWTDKYHRTFVARQRLVKAVRANLLLKWMHAHFPGMPIILQLRHPCPVARSILGRKRRPPSFDMFLTQEELMEDYLDPFRTEMEAAETDFEKLIFRWCIETYVPLQQFRQGEIHLAFYENFCVSPESEIDRLFAFLDKSYDEKVFKQLERPSPVTRATSAIVAGDNLVDGWKAKMSAEQMQRAIEIVGLFGLDGIYGEDSMPNVERAYEMLAVGPVRQAVPAGDNGLRQEHSDALAT